MTVHAEEFDHRYATAAAAATRRGSPRNTPASALAVLFIPPGPAAGAWRDICATYCNGHRYSVVAIASTLAAVMTLVASGRANIVVVGRREHLVGDGDPVRIEFANEVAELPAGSRRPVRRR